jgi:hypothetical protein
MDEVIDQIKYLLNKEISGDEYPLFPEKGLILSAKNYHEINSKTNKSICFIDGGNAEIIGSNNYSLQKIRVAGVIYENNKRIKIEKKDYYVLITMGDEILVKTFPEEINFEMKRDDEFLKEGRSIGKISKIGNLVRRMAEIQLAKKMNSDIIVLDGSLEEKSEKEKLKELFNSKKTIIGLSKTNSIVTNKGRSLSVALDKEGSWYYTPILEKEYLICFAKLHPKSKYVFKIDLINGDFNTVCYNLSENSKDPVFIGYPYGLIDVDREARISNKEIEFLKTQFMIKLGKDWEKVKQAMTTNNAHEILDSIS